MGRVLHSVCFLLACLHAGLAAVWNFGHYERYSNVFAHESGDISILQHTVSIPLTVPWCYTVTSVRVEVHNPLSTPEVTFNEDTNTVLIHYKLFQISPSKYDIIAMGKAKKNCYDSDGSYDLRPADYERRSLGESRNRLLATPGNTISVKNHKLGNSNEVQSYNPYLPSYHPNRFDGGPALGPHRFDGGPALGPHRFDVGPAHGPQRFDSGPAYGPQRFDSGPAYGPHRLDDGPALGPHRFDGGPALGPHRFDGGPAHGPQRFDSGPAYGPQRLDDGPALGPHRFDSGPAYGPHRFDGGSAHGSHRFDDGPAHGPHRFDGGPAHGPHRFDGGPAHGPHRFDGGPAHGPHRLDDGPAHRPHRFSDDIFYQPAGYDDVPYNLQDHKSHNHKSPLYQRDHTAGNLHNTAEYYTPSLEQSSKQQQHLFNLPSLGPYQVRRPSSTPLNN